MYNKKLILGVIFLLFISSCSIGNKNIEDFNTGSIKKGENKLSDNQQGKNSCLKKEAEIVELKQEISELKQKLDDFIKERDEGLSLEMEKFRKKSEIYCFKQIAEVEKEADYVIQKEKEKILKECSKPIKDN